MDKPFTRQKVADVPTQPKGSAHSGIQPAHQATNCRQVSVARPEDITVDPSSGMAFISSVEGAIYGLDLQSDSLEPVNLTRDLPSGFVFRPHGISLYLDADGENRLFAVNHRAKYQHSIEIFSIETSRLRHLRSISDRLLVSPNDLVAIGREQFYVTNDSGYRPTFMKGMELVFRLAKGSVVYYDKEFTKVADGIAMANGIAVDRVHKRLYVSAFQSEKILVYAWDPDNPAHYLGEPDEILLSASPDNLEWDQAGDLWIGAHPSFWASLLYIFHLRKTAPSQVIRLRLTGVAKPVPEEVFRDDGTKLSASSVAAVYQTETKHYLLIGALDSHFLMCDLRPLELQE